MTSFQERFKDKLSTVGKNGDLFAPTSKPVVKPRSAFQTSANSMMQTDSSSAQHTRPNCHEQMNINKSTDTISLKVPHTSNAAYKPHSIQILPEKKFVPYTLKDYKCIQFDKYYELGGLGAYNIGTEDWKKKTDALRKRNDYAKQANWANITTQKSFLNYNR